MRIVERERWSLQGWCEEPATSASYEELERRPELRELLERAATFDVIICDESSRWSRNGEITDLSFRILRKHGVWWQTADDMWDINKPFQEGFDVAWAVTQVTNAGFSRKLSYHVSKGKGRKAVDGYSNGKPMFGYRFPAMQIRAEIGNTAQERALRRRIVYEPHPQRYPVLVRLGEFLAMQPPLSLAEIALRMNQLDYTYFSSIKNLEVPWNEHAISKLAGRTYPREFALGCGHGTIQTPKGDLVEGLHIAAWSYEICERINENRGSVRVSPSRKSHTIAPFSGMAFCVHCNRGMRTSKNSKTGQVPRPVYWCWPGYLKPQPCPVSAPNQRSFVNSHLIEHQFGLLLEQLGQHSNEIIAAIQRTYAGDQQQSHEDPLIAYNRAMDSIKLRRENIRKQHSWGYVDDIDLHKQMAELRAEEARLRKPEPRDTQHKAALQAVSYLKDVAFFWNTETGDPHRRHKIAHALISPNGLLVDTMTRKIVGIQPRPGMYLAMKTALSHYGWHESGEGALWSSERDIKHEGSTRMFQVIQALRELGPSTVKEIAVKIGYAPRPNKYHSDAMEYSNLASVLRNMHRRGYVSREVVDRSHLDGVARNGNEMRYTWTYGDEIPVVAMRRSPYGG